MASVGILASGVAHEIKNPLAALAANVELACGELDHLDDMNAAASAEQLQALSRLHAELNDARESSARIRDVVQDLSVLSRSDVEASHPVDLHMVLENALRVTANLTRHSATVVRKLGAIPPVLGDETRLGQLFRNLIMNAVSSIPSGNADKNEIRITTSFQAGDDSARGPRVVIEVIDTGRGMDESVARRLFTPFFTTKPVGAGIGLELAICHRIATALGGTITARSRKDGGSVFRVELPSSDGAALAQPAAASQPSAAAPRTQRRGRVLLIDDDRLVLNTLSRVFEREHDAVATLSASEALTIVAEQGPFDVILCDLMMPNTSGMSFYEKLAKTSPRSAEKVVFMTGGAFNPDAQNFLAHVKNAHVAKPFDLDAVRALVRSRIEPREAGA
jgi:CheY-like chemotaxis protein